MQRTFNAFEKATIKNSAKAVAHYLAKNEKIQEKINALTEEYNSNLALIEQYSEPVRNLTGYEPSDLCEKVSRGSQNDWVFKYPDTVTPPVPNAEPEKKEEKEEKKEEEVKQQPSLTEEKESLKEEPIVDELPNLEEVDPMDENPFEDIPESNNNDDFFSPNEF